MERKRVLLRSLCTNLPLLHQNRTHRRNLPFKRAQLREKKTPRIMRNLLSTRALRHRKVPRIRKQSLLRNRPSNPKSRIISRPQSLLPLDWIFLTLRLLLDVLSLNLEACTAMWFLCQIKIANSLGGLGIF